MHAQSPLWQGPLSREEVTYQLRAALFGKGRLRSASTPEAMMAEVLRAVVWALNVHKQDALRSETSANTRRILAHARAIWEPLREGFNVRAVQQSQKELSGGSEETFLERETLEALEAQGDILSLPGGFWLPAPIRLVPLGNTAYLLAGGLPTHLLPQTLLASLNFHGSFRQTYISAKEQLPTSTYIERWQYQALSNWLGPTPPTLSELIHYFSSQTLLQVSEQRSQDVPYEAYDAHIAKPQGFRWQPVDTVPDGHYLLRTQTWWGTKQYSIGKIEKHRLVRQSNELQPSQIEVRRLCYALDQKMKTPTTAEFAHKMLTLRSELPVRERRLVAAMATLKPGEHYYPRVWSGIHDKHKETVHNMLRQLGISLISEHNIHVK